MRGDEERKLCLDTAEQHRNTKTNSTHNTNIYTADQKIYKDRAFFYDFYCPVCRTVKTIKDEFSTLS